VLKKLYNTDILTKQETVMENDNNTDLFEELLMWAGGTVLLTLALAVLGTSLGYFVGRCGL
jgi:hypothetical protein